MPSREENLASKLLLADAVTGTGARLAGSMLIMVTTNAA